MKEEFDSSEMSSAGLFWEHVKQDISTDMEIHMKTSDLLSPKKSPVQWGSAAKLWVNLSWHLGPTTYWWTQSHLYLDLQLILSKCWGSLLATVKSCRYFIDWKIPETFNKVQIHLGMTHYAMIWLRMAQTYALLIMIGPMIAGLHLKGRPKTENATKSVVLQGNDLLATFRIKWHLSEHETLQRTEICEACLRKANVGLWLVAFVFLPAWKLRWCGSWTFMQ